MGLFVAPDIVPYTTMLVGGRFRRLRVDNTATTCSTYITTAGGYDFFYYALFYKEFRFDICFLHDFIFVS